MRRWLKRPRLRALEKKRMFFVRRRTGLKKPTTNRGEEEKGMVFVESITMARGTFGVLNGMVLDGWCTSSDVNSLTFRPCRCSSFVALAFCFVLRYSSFCCLFFFTRACMLYMLFYISFVAVLFFSDDDDVVICEGVMKL